MGTVGWADRDKSRATVVVIMSSSGMRMGRGDVEGEGNREGSDCAAHTIVRIV
jgi:hypothetical protein